MTEEADEGHGVVWPVYGPQQPPNQNDLKSFAKKSGSEFFLICAEICSTTGERLSGRRALMFISFNEMQINACTLFKVDF